MITLNHKCPDCGKEWTEQLDEKRNALLLELLGVERLQTVVCERCSMKHEEIREAQEKLKWYTDMLEESGMPEAFRGMKDGDPELIAAFENNSEKHVYLCGNRGIGKTRAACIAAKRLLWKEQKSIKFHEFSSLLLDYSLTSRGRDANPKGFVYNAFDADIVILDDYGKKRLTENACELLWYLFNGAYTKSLRCKLWITAEFPFSYKESDYADKDIGGAISSRIERMQQEGTMAILDFTRVRGLAKCS